MNFYFINNTQHTNTLEDIYKETDLINVKDKRYILQMLSNNIIMDMRYKHTYCFYIISVTSHNIINTIYFKLHNRLYEYIWCQNRSTMVIATIGVYCNIYQTRSMGNLYFLYK